MMEVFYRLENLLNHIVEVKFDKDFNVDDFNESVKLLRAWATHTEATAKGYEELTELLKGRVSIERNDKNLEKNPLIIKGFRKRVSWDSYCHIYHFLNYLKQMDEINEKENKNEQHN